MLDLDKTTAKAQAALDAAEVAIQEATAAVGGPEVVARALATAAAATPFPIPGMDAGPDTGPTGLAALAAAAIKLEQLESDGEAAIVSVNTADRPLKRKRKINVGAQSPTKRRCVGYVDLTD